MTIIALSGDLAVKAATAGSDLARRATGLDVQRHEVSGPDRGPIPFEEKPSPELLAIVKEAERIVIAQSPRSDKAEPSAVGEE